MPFQPPDRQIWQALYAATARFYAMKPWTWMSDSDVFGVRDPVSGETGYCCIMGAAEEHYALAVYLGTEGLQALIKIGLQEIPSDPFEVLLMQKCLMASFEDRDMMKEPDLATIRELGLKFRGRNAWPQFRSYLPGFEPWTLTQQEARFLAVALEQACEVAPRFMDRPDVLATQNALNNYELYLVRTSQIEGGQRVWSDSLEAPGLYEPTMILPAPPDMKRIERLTASTKRSDGILDIDFFYMPSAVLGEDGGRPWFPEIILCVDDTGGSVLHFEMVKTGELGRVFGETFLDLTDKMRQLPARVQVKSDQAQLLIEPTLAALDVDLVRVDSLPPIEEAQQGLFQMLG